MKISIYDRWVFRFKKVSQQLLFLFLLISKWKWHWHFFKATSYANLGIYFRDSHDSPIIVYTKLILVEAFCTVGPQPLLLCYDPLVWAKRVGIGLVGTALQASLCTSQTYPMQMRPDMSVVGWTYGVVIAIIIVTSITARIHYSKITMIINVINKTNITRGVNWVIVE